MIQGTSAIPRELRTGTSFTAALMNGATEMVSYTAKSYDSAMDWAKAQDVNADILIITTEKGNSVSFKRKPRKDGSVWFSQIP